jgi:thiol-disulfide isomerase/thioredoxin
MKTNTNSAFKLIIFIGAFLIFGKAAAQQTNILNIGDQPPQLKYSKWIKGEPIKSFSNDKLYVLEFWATWCGPCKAAMPHLTKLQNQYKEKAEFIGVAVWEKVPEDQPYESSLPSVEKFVKGNDANMGYSIIADNNERFMGNNWLKAAGENGIPSTFIIKDNKIIWIGHPSSLDTIIPKILEGRYDMEAFKTKFKKSAESTRKQNAELMAIFTPIQDAVKAKEYAKAFDLMDKLKTAQPNFKDPMNIMKFKILLTEVNEKEAIEFAKVNKLAPGFILEQTYNADGLSKGTYLWVANNFGNTSSVTNPIVLNALASCYAKGGDYKAAVANQAKALELAKKALKNGTMIGTIMDYTIVDYETKLKQYKIKVN